MSKVKFFLVIGFGILFLSSCKKDYECCYFDAQGVKIEEGEFTCGSLRNSEKDIEKLESRMENAATEWNGSANCEAVTIAR